MGILDSLLRKNKELTWMYDLDLFEDDTTNAYLKRATLQTCIEFIARTLSQTEFKITQNHKPIKDDSYYKLNVRPNTDMSATDFWQKVIYKLIYDNEVLIVVNDTKDLLIVDDFERKKYAMYPDIFKHVVIDEYEFERSFNMDEVIYLTYNNNALGTFIEGMFEDYGTIFGRMIKAQMRNYQIRGVLKMDSSKVGKSEEQEKLQAYVDNVLKAFSNNAVAIAPLTNNLEYQESNNANKGNAAPFNELTNLKKAMVDEVAKALGIPPSLIHGDMADLENAMESYIKFCIKPLLKKFEDELNAKLIAKEELLNGKRIKAISIDKKDPLEMAEAIDKLVSSSTFTPNQVLILLGEDPSDDPNMDKYFITKNYTKSNESTVKGGDKDEDKR
ncbi:phage portal protein [Staphylococcus coagulans]|uniref:phage portal protein n=1 Tax=Staphylococcus coagulans TaxID=74706 RepID=UPI001BEC8250|nr:phage portal protein [Staphylococcus coagulans]MBT2823081.1 phage portal protein [Staphylococcus coagulans]MBT2834324.1 phage portal protein [Staphylococcus coagulans]MBT2852384.1 phage portal protein [Staphylococcus coagulans]MBT2860968.1 phage portal protein [Staphylococcus coagulans]MBT2864090.1 phage portal protein [Staphylococcus coagulans]